MATSANRPRRTDHARPFYPWPTELQTRSFERRDLGLANRSGAYGVNRPKKVAVLGSTGSIGRSALEVLESQSDDFELTCMSCHQQIELFEKQCLEHQPALAIVTDEFNPSTRQWLAASDSTSMRRAAGSEALIQSISGPEVDIVIAAIVGVAGLESSLAAVQNGKRLALANKESLVVAGQLLLSSAKESRAEIIPVDSEHCAIFQALQCDRPGANPGQSVQRIILTASGGPLRDWPLEDLEKATIQDALAHPTWSMGRKITVDSATMMNKALEVIEAHWLFGLEAERIQVVIHPQSIIHSMVEFTDGSVIAQLSPPDMRLPIQYALTYPKRTPGPAKRMDWNLSQTLSWYPVDPERYPALQLGFEVAQRGGTCGAVLNAANEAAVELFLSGHIRLTDIAKICRSVLQHHNFAPTPNLNELLEQDRWARDEVMRWNRSLC
jgi:1-deoxy-D-xylulose-5-phosphate reductoisomerase